MNRSLSTQFAAFGLALLATVSLMGGIQQLASAPAPHDTLVQAAPADGSTPQVVVITAKRIA